MSSETDDQEENEARELAEIAAIQAKFTAIIADLTQARAGIEEIIRFLGACGYGLNQHDLGDLGAWIDRAISTLTEMCQEY